MGSFKEFISSIKSKDKVAILHDRDPDGVCSAVLVAKGLEGLGLRMACRLNQEKDEHTITEKSIEKLRKAKITKLITCDLPLDYNVPAVRKAEKFFEMLVLDHHKPNAEINSKRTVMIRGQELTGKYCPTSMLAYRLFSEFSDRAGLAPYTWIASAGTIADGGYPYWKKIVNSSLRRSGATMENLEMVTKIINSMCLYEEEKLVDIIFKGLGQASSPEEIINNEKYQKYFRDVNREVGKWLARAEKEARVVNGYIVYAIKPKLPVLSPVCTNLAYAHPDKTIILLQDRGKNFVQLSLRRSDGKQDVASIVRELVRGLPKSDGGGHPVASGGRVLRKSLKEVMNRIERKVGV